MTNHPKYEQILDALQNLMESRSIQSISVSEIAQTAGMGKGSIYYYFPARKRRSRSPGPARRSMPLFIRNIWRT